MRVAGDVDRRRGPCAAAASPSFPTPIPIRLMIIECPTCHERAKLPDSKEGAKVRCPSCNRVYRAFPPGRAPASTGPSPLVISLGIGGIVILALIFYFVNQSKPGPVVPVEEPEEVVKRDDTDLTGWNSKPVKAVRTVYTAAQNFDQGRLASLIDPARTWAWRQNREAAGQEGEQPPSEAASPEASPPDAPPVDAADPKSPEDFHLLDEATRLTFVDETVAAMVQGEEEYAPYKWKPWEGQVISETPEEAVVRVKVDRIGSEVHEVRTMEWRLVEYRDRWLVWSWERWISPEEAKASRVARRRKYEQRTLSDGSIVIEAEPCPLAHLPDTPADLRRRIDGLYAKIIDLSLTTEASDARQELVKIGKPALPVLLTGLYEIPLETETQAMQINMIVQALREITGQWFGFKPMEAFGMAGGTSEERRQSAIKQWFGWWYRKGHKFEQIEEQEDLLEGLIELTPKEKRELERDRSSKD